MSYDNHSHLVDNGNCVLVTDSGRDCVAYHTVSPYLELGFHEHFLHETKTLDCDTDCLACIDVLAKVGKMNEIDAIEIANLHFEEPIVGYNDASWQSYCIAHCYDQYFASVEMIDYTSHCKSSHIDLEVAGVGMTYHDNMDDVNYDVVFRRKDEDGTHSIGNKVDPCIHLLRHDH